MLLEVVTMANQEEIQKFIIQQSKLVNDAILTIYRNLLKYRQEHAEEIEPYILREIDNIIYCLEVSEDYNTALKKLHYIELKTSAHTCKYSYVNKIEED